MGDVYTRGRYYEKQCDALKDYLITDTVRLSLLIDPSLDSKELEQNLFKVYLEPVDKLIEAHKELSHILEEQLGRESLSDESKGIRK